MLLFEEKLKMLEAGLDMRGFLKFEEFCARR